MGWSIGVLKNEVTITVACADELADWLKDNLGVWEPLGEDGKIDFNEDWGESMDFLFHDEVQDILRRHDAEGDVCFGSLEGDNAGTFWGYRFKGTDPVVRLKGTVVFEPEA